MRGLKFLGIKGLKRVLAVASFTDAWIEITVTTSLIGIYGVASFTDAWIEILVQTPLI